MKHIVNKKTLDYILLTLLFVLLSLSFVRCSDDKEDKSSVYLEQLQKAKSSLEYMKDNSVYGLEKGNYPIESKQILIDAISEIDNFISNNSDLNEDKVEQAITRANIAIDKFKDTMRFENSKNPITEGFTQTLIEKSLEMKDLLDNSTYGLKEGYFPTESKDILELAITEIDKFVSDIKSELIPDLDETKVNAAIQKADRAIVDFNATQRTEDYLQYDLFVDGNNGGYIDFGNSADFVKFGNQGQQSFTIELWIKIKDYCNKAGEDNSTFLSTFVSNDTYSSGWRVQSRNQDIFRGSVGIVDVNNNDRHIWEPAFSFTNKNEWVHFVFVYSDRGNEEHEHIRSKVFKNGVATGDVIRIGETERQYNSSAAVTAQKSMTAFARFELNGDKTEYFSGYMRKMRIWKTIKSASEVRALYEGAEIDPDDPDLVCGWDFDQIPADNNNMKDITGHHSAKLVGAFTWERRPIDY